MTRKPPSQLTHDATPTHKFPLPFSPPLPLSLSLGSLSLPTVMNRRKWSTVSFRFANWVISAGQLGPNSLCNQVTQLSHISRTYSYLVSKLHPCGLYNAHNKLFFSSRPHSMVMELLSSKDWSKDIEMELEKCNPRLTHEDAIYVLKKLDRNPQKALDFFNWVSGRNTFHPSSLLYSLLLRILASKEFMKQFWIVIKAMKEKGFYIDKETYLTIRGWCLKNEGMDKDAVAFTHFYNRMIQENPMNDVVKNVVEVMISGSDFDVGVESKLMELKIPMCDNFVLRTLKELRSHPLRALEFFRWVSKSSDYEHTSVTHCGLARVLAQRESIKEFWSVVKDMRNKGLEMDVDTYIKISRNLQNDNMVKDAVELYEFMMDGPYELTDSNCILLLRRISVDPDLDLVFRVVKKYEAAGHTLSKPFYDVIHRSLTTLGRFDEAEKIMQTMTNTAGCEPDNITYSQLVFGLCKANKLEEACKLVDDMETNGCVPDVKTWTILIKGHCASSEVEKAVLCFAKMMGKNVDVDGELLEVLINGFLAQKKLNGAYTLLVEMVNKARVKPWQATYKLLIEKLLANGQLEEALNLLRMMKKHNYPPFPDPFVQYISKYGTVEDAKEFLSESSVKNQASNTAYLHIFRALFKEGRHSEAKDLLYMSPARIRNHKEVGYLFGSTKRAGAGAKTPA
ncbi:hypothetical protein Dimus_004680 [Dionaea muscipula]